MAIAVRIAMPETLRLAVSRFTFPSTQLLADCQAQREKRSELEDGIAGLREFFHGVSTLFVQRGQVLVENTVVEPDAAVVLLSSYLGDVDPRGNDGDPSHVVSDVTPAVHQGRVSMAASSSGAGEFHLHTDSANLAVPHRAVALACVQADNQGGGQSIAVSADAVVDKMMTLGLAESVARLAEPVYPYMSGFGYEDRQHKRAASVMKVPILWRDAEFWRIRYAPQFIKPAMAHNSLPGRYARALEDLRRALTLIEVQEFALRTGDLWIVDNSRLVHGRRAIKSNYRRLLKRCKIY